jgi:hypothetical protein
VQWKLATLRDDYVVRWRNVIDRLRSLKAEGRLSPEQATYLPKAEENLARMQRQ